MANVEKANEAAEKVARTTGDALKTIVDHTVSLQERNVRFAQSAADSYVKEVRQRTESNRAILEEVAGRAEKQRDAYQDLVSESVDAYMDLLYTPLSYYKQGLQFVENEVTGSNGFGGFPIPNYDKLNVGEISGQIDSLSADEIRTLRDYEKSHKNRDSLLEQFDRKLKPSVS